MDVIPPTPSTRYLLPLGQVRLVGAGQVRKCESVAACPSALHRPNKESKQQQQQQQQQQHQQQHQQPPSIVNQARQSSAVCAAAAAAWQTALVLVQCSYQHAMLHFHH